MILRLPLSLLLAAYVSADVCAVEYNSSACLQDVFYRPTLPLWISKFTNDEASPSTCMARCLELDPSSRYIGITVDESFKFRCACGREFFPSEFSRGTCTASCPGESSVLCGGRGYSMSVYSLKYCPPSPPSPDHVPFVPPAPYPATSDRIPFPAPPVEFRFTVMEVVRMYVIYIIVALALSIIATVFMVMTPQPGIPSSPHTFDAFASGNADDAGLDAINALALYEISIGTADLDSIGETYSVDRPITSPVAVRRS